MIIRIIPEKGENIQAAEHSGISDFFIFGNKKDSEGTYVDFHDWKGSYRYLIGSLSYFSSTLQAEQIEKKIQDNMTERTVKSKPEMKVFKTPITQVPQVEEEKEGTPLVKTVECNSELKVLQFGQNQENQEVAENKEED